MRLSLVIPLYNKKSTLLRAVRSALAQQPAFAEIIIINDGSTDDSASLLTGLIKKHPTLHLYHQTNQGVAAARNLGVQLASGSHICFLDADDQLLPGYTQALSQLIKTYPQATLYSTAYTAIRQKQPEQPTRQAQQQTPPGQINARPLKTYRKKPRLLCASSVCLPSALARLHPFPVGYRLGEDLYVWIQLMMKGSWACQSQPLVKVDKTAENRSSHWDAPQLPAYLNFLVHPPATDNQCQTRDLRLFLIKNLLVYQAYGTALQGRPQVIHNLRQFLLAHRFTKLALLAYPAQLVAQWRAQNLNNVKKHAN